MRLPMRAALARRNGYLIGYSEPSLLVFGVLFWRVSDDELGRQCGRVQWSTHRTRIVGAVSIKGDPTATDDDGGPATQFPAPVRCVAAGHV